MNAYVPMWDLAIWPLTVLALASAFRTELAALIGRIRKLEGKAFGTEWVALLDVAVAEAKLEMEEGDMVIGQIVTVDVPESHERRPELKSLSATVRPTRSGIKAALMLVARSSAKVAIDRAGAEIQTAIEDIGRKWWPKLDADQVIWQLQKEGFTSVQLAAQFIRLYRLRHDARNAARDGIKSDDAERYIELALQMAEDIRTAGVRMDAEKPTVDTP